VPRHLRAVFVSHRTDVSRFTDKRESLQSEGLIFLPIYQSYTPHHDMAAIQDQLADDLNHAMLDPIHKT
jgi:hypothetical protein